MAIDTKTTQIAISAENLATLKRGCPEGVLTIDTVVNRAIEKYAEDHVSEPADEATQKIIDRLPELQKLRFEKQVKDSFASGDDVVDALLSNAVNTIANKAKTSETMKASRSDKTEEQLAEIKKAQAATKAANEKAEKAEVAAQLQKDSGSKPSEAEITEAWKTQKSEERAAKKAARQAELEAEIEALKAELE